MVNDREDIISLLLLPILYRTMHFIVKFHACKLTHFTPLLTSYYPQQLIFNIDVVSDLETIHNNCKVSLPSISN